jgi:hypothetical protein
MASFRFAHSVVIRQVDRRRQGMRTAGRSVKMNGGIFNLLLAETN